MHSSATTKTWRNMNPETCPTCGGELFGLLNELGRLNNGGKQIWFCLFPCNKVVTEAAKESQANPPPPACTEPQTSR